MIGSERETILAFKVGTQTVGRPISIRCYIVIHKYYEGKFLFLLTICADSPLYGISIWFKEYVPGVDVGGSDPGFGLYADRLAKTDWNEGVMVVSVLAVEVTEDEVDDEVAGADAGDATVGGEEDEEDGRGGDDDDVVATAIAAMAAAARAAVCNPLPEDAAVRGNMWG